ncbi:VRR-NUC domain-containing protein [Bradyrhizobium sp. CCGB20]|uniref:VRR-NUC domain-containing protein n=1 Tax=Bradyrhizobium sp. CCGB20 TaxID=2949633 RepID=UPI0020B2A183|nr:VRR-NUC domain-containing protein [Bradyrhizobium sp. CCGB20]MCP3396225.1 VRR-NUC domain-containing protein [Bradyrhizobium sp. CCGB20]
MVLKLSGRKEYKRAKISNRREAVVADQLDREDFVVLKTGWPDLFAFNPVTRKARFVEVKAGSQYAEKIPPNGRVHHNLGLKDQLRMHQFLKKIGIEVEIHWVD